MKWLEADAECCRFRVSDNDPGIAQADQAAIFQPFWQAPEARGQGTGLGPAIARGIVEAHGRAAKSPSVILDHA